MNKQELIVQMAKLISGLQVPYSIDPKMLGTAGPALVTLRNGLRLCGWITPEEVENALREAMFGGRQAVYHDPPPDE